MQKKSMFLHFLPAAFKRLTLNSFSRRLVLPILLTGLMSACSSETALQPGFDLALQQAYGSTASNNKHIDLSKGAADQIGMRGLTEVKVEYLGS